MCNINRNTTTKRKFNKKSIATKIHMKRVIIIIIAINNISDN